MPIYRCALMAALLLGDPWAAARSMMVQANPAAASPDPAKVLADVQGRINAARLQAVTANDAAALEEIATQLRSINAGSTGQAAYYSAYWLAYTDYLIASRRLKDNRRPEAASMLNEAATLLNNISTKDVETYTLLSLVAGLRIVAGGSETISEAMRQARDALERAIALDPKNARVLYARALADYTTPKEYGGGRVAEGFAWQAIGRPAESTRGLKPAWGHDDSAALLVKILRASGRDADATALLTRFSAEYPISAPLHQVSGTPK